MTIVYDSILSHRLILTRSSELGNHPTREDKSIDGSDWKLILVSRLGSSVTNEDAQNAQDHFARV